MHHVATMYPLEVQLAQALAQGTAVEGVTWDVVHDMNARHAEANDAVTKEVMLELLRRTVRRLQSRAGPSPTMNSIAPRRYPSTRTLRSPASSCSKITRADTAITTSPEFAWR